jgi:ADP-L-glycero-D-manno-heptose 6-epimerase
MSRKLILVTGGAGFIGSNIVAELTQRGERDVAVCDRLRAADSGKWRNLAKHPIADFVAPEQMFAWMDAHAGELAGVIHMGAISSTTEADADKIIQTNFVLSRDIWTWCARQGTPLVYASSAATYGEGSAGFVDADDLRSLSELRPLNAYGWSKKLFDLYARRASEAGSAPPQWAGLKFFNVYGPNEQHKGEMKSVVAKIWPSVMKGEEIRLFRSHRPDYADGGQMRDFVYVKDVAALAVWLLGREVSGIFNAGTGKARSFKDLALATFAAADREPKIGYVDTPAVIRDKYQYFTEADMRRVTALGYDVPFSSLEDGVKDYVQSHLCGEDPYR